MIHCTASSQRIKAADVVNLHRNVFKWSRVGYRLVVEPDGNVVELVPANENCVVEDSEITFGAAEWNPVCHHVCYIGGVDSANRAFDNRTRPQIRELAKICYRYIERICPDVKIAGHNQFHNKACPSFWVPTFLRNIGIDDKNIYEKDPFGYSKILK